ncbi:stress response translation initiation inhibitor YciH [Aurantivibrio plasticivorans]
MSKNRNDSRLVYSTESGRIKEQPETATPPPTDGIVRISYETKGRNGKGVTVIRGLGLAGKELQQLAKKLKQRCGTGGSVKDFNIEIQGDHRQLLKTQLEGQSYAVKFSGG